MIKDELELLKRGAVEIIPENGLEQKLKKSHETKKPLVIKAGFDPTAPDIHLGHTVPLRKMRQFQDLGHEVVFLIGDYTGMIGDPSAKSKTRKLLTKEEVLQNAETYKKQVSKILDLKKLKIEFNSRWLSDMNLSDFSMLASKVTVARILERDDFQERYKKGESISLLEFFYPVLQGYDSLFLNADIELGGTDQKFNLLMGRAIQKSYEKEEQVIMTFPLLEGLDGKEKMSKSLGNYVGISEPSNEMFGKIMSINDDMMFKYFELLTNIPITVVEQYKKDIKSGRNPKEIKVILAKDIVRQYYSEEKAEFEAAEFDRVFRDKKAPQNIEELEVNNPEMKAFSLTQTACNPISNTAAKTLHTQGAVEYDSKVIKEFNQVLKLEDGKILKVGRRFWKIKIKK